VSTVRFETQTFVASDLGGESPLADLPVPPPQAFRIPIDPKWPPERKAFIRAADSRTCLPYRVLNRYDRSEVERPFRVAVVENETVRGTFLLDLGGRLWSVIHKPTGRELLYRPDVIYYANIAICNAWICGGVEWNIGQRGHAAFTVRPLFAARLTADDGTPVLRLYEYDRFRGLVFQIDCFAPDGSPALYVRPRVINPNDVDTPMYWWSNVSVEDADGHRVLAPASTAYHYAYSGGLEEVPVPINKSGLDTSYPKNLPAAHDWFFKIPEGNRPWISSLDPSGRGLVHASTALLKGRKLFLWGQGRGGHRWQAHLGGKNGRGYVEIQAGLGRTQGEYLIMPPHAEWAWLEAYMLMEADPKIVHAGPDSWAEAHRHVQARLDAMLPQAQLDAVLSATAAMANRPPEEILVRASGWGALEQHRRQADGEPPLAPPSMVFDDASLGAAEAPWLALLEKGALPARAPTDDPATWMNGDAWRKRLASSARKKDGNHWLTYLHLGAAAYRAQKVPAAVAAWEKSAAAEANPWAYRNLGCIARARGRKAESADLYQKAGLLAPDLAELQLEVGRALAGAERPKDLEQWIAGLPAKMRALPRVEILAALDEMWRGQLDQALARLESVHLTDNREGDNAISDLWYEIKARQAAAAEGVPFSAELLERITETLDPPAHLDYRMAQPVKKAKRRKRGKK